MIVVIRLFALLKGAKSGLNAGFCGWEWGLLCGESGVCVIGLFRFRLKKKGGMSHDVPMLKKILVDIQARLTFLYFVF